MLRQYIAESTPFNLQFAASMFSNNIAFHYGVLYESINFQPNLKRQQQQQHQIWKFVHSLSESSAIKLTHKTFIFYIHSGHRNKWRLNDFVSRKKANNQSLVWYVRYARHFSMKAINSDEDVSKNSTKPRKRRWKQSNRKVKTRKEKYSGQIHWWINLMSNRKVSHWPTYKQKRKKRRKKHRSKSILINSSLMSSILHIARPYRKILNEPLISCSQSANAPEHIRVTANDRS